MTISRSSAWLVNPAMLVYVVQGYSTETISQSSRAPKPEDPSALEESIETSGLERMFQKLHAKQQQDMQHMYAELMAHIDRKTAFPEATPDPSA
ncbi:hypothetical protein BC832DRAFT_620859 [Gaertneriomyces semiglobifer]|nr:hypothetical protein BC832DRAFT_620859 [Gaertneriomyces semiglobifer]